MPLINLMHVVLDNTRVLLLGKASRNEWIWFGSLIIRISEEDISNMSLENNKGFWPNKLIGMNQEGLFSK